MRFRNPYWSDRTRFELMQKWLLVHSYLYYIMNRSVVTDSMFDKNSRQLVEMMQASPEAFKASKYYSVFRDWDGTTGYHLWDRLEPYQQSIIRGIAEGLVIYLGVSE